MKNNKILLITLITSVLLGILLALPTSTLSQTIFDDQFLGSTVSSASWHIPTWQYNGDGTYLAATQFRCSQNAGLPKCVNNNASIAVETYNPTGYSFYGTDLIANSLFYTSTNELVFTARLKTDQVQSGTVFAFFLYAPPSSGGGHDEIDFEFVGNEPSAFNTNIYGNEPLGPGHPQFISYQSGSISSYHDYEIHWSTGKVSWWVDGTQVRQVTTGSSIPAGPMYLHFNAWVPSSDTWSAAYSSTISPVSSSSANTIWSMSVDSVDVTWGGIQIPTSIITDPTSATLSIGNSLPITANCLDQHGNIITSATFTWSSDKTLVATVNSSGVVKAIASGSANITVTSGTASAKVAINVPQPTPSISITSVAPYGQLGSVSGKVGTGYSGYDIAVIINVDGGWWSKPYSGQTLSPINSGGNWSVYFTTGGFDHDATEVRAYLVPLGITPPELSGGGIPSDYDSYSYASVIRTALVPTSIAVSPPSLSLENGDTASLSATCLDQNGSAITGVSFGWSSDNSDYAAVDSSGWVTAVSPGSANIILTCGSLTTSVPVTVSAIYYPQIVISSVPPIGSNGNISGKVGPGWKSYKVAVLLNVYGGWWSKPTFKSPLTKIGSGRWVARLTTGGHDAYGSEARAYLIPIGVSMPLCSGGDVPASYDQYTYDDIVRPWPALSSVRVTPSSIKLLAGQSSSLTAKAYGGNVQIPASFSWTSANGAIATVDQNGFVQANSHGSTKITVVASTSDRTRKITVNVIVR